MLPEIETCQQIIAAAQECIKKIQEGCAHPVETLYKIYDANTGGYDGPEFDQYWADFKCYVCSKFWTVDYKKDPDGYRRKANEVKTFPKN